ncbi:peptide deformylase [Dyadobacter sp. LJ53]|uniref:peptide deformylase n=1 Tax=Dyadobacter chenwenxiniae TaxID=2906456 RepID=UPI001F408658|nr:peptide deformylase [Dyadobacter chenwenxiniae]MCF0052667.1 peptide deformylase [Dyadobacter chenwenxiniae]
MILPIFAYGCSTLRQPCTDVQTNIVASLIDDMWETMYHANGCGLAAPQIGRNINLFIVDSKGTYEGLEAHQRQDFFDENDKGLVETFVNANIVWRSGSVWTDDEGCLSIPGLVLPVTRSWSIKIEYSDQHFVKKYRSFDGLTARMIQHEFDHTRGILHIDYLNSLRKKLVKNKLKRVSKGLVKSAYPMHFSKR